MAHSSVQCGIVDLSLAHYFLTFIPDPQKQLSTAGQLVKALQMQHSEKEVNVRSSALNEDTYSKAIFAFIP